MTEEPSDFPDKPEPSSAPKQESLPSELTRYSPNREAPPTYPQPSGQPKQRTFQDLLPEFATLTTAEVADPKVVGIILGILREKMSELAILKSDLEAQGRELNGTRANLISATTKLQERWKSSLLLQLLSAIGSLAIGFAFKFPVDHAGFAVLLVAGILIMLLVAIMTWVVKRGPEK